MLEYRVSHSMFVKGRRKNKEIWCREVDYMIKTFCLEKGVIEKVGLIICCVALRAACLCCGKQTKQARDREQHPTRTSKKPVLGKRRNALGSLVIHHLRRCLVRRLGPKGAGFLPLSMSHRPTSCTRCAPSSRLPTISWYTPCWAIFYRSNLD